MTGLGGAHNWMRLLVVMATLLGTAVTAGCARPSPALGEELESARQDRFPVVIRKPLEAPRIATGTFDEMGRPVSVSCATCHATKPPAAGAKLGTPLTQFHQALAGQHGNLTCASCHNLSDGYSSLRLADGKGVPYSEVMQLCAQCHGTQYRDYQHGAHGGMTGFWDLTRGGRERNNCIDCHHPHAPKYPTVNPARGPNDRFQTRGRHE